MSRLFGETLRAAPADLEAAGPRLLLRAGYVRPVAAGIFSHLPLGVRVRRKIGQIIREEMDAIGGQEVTMPLVQPGELWRRSGRWADIDEELVRFTDRTGRDLVLAMTHEEVAADLARSVVHSYRQLPRLIYQIQTKFRDDPRPRAGLIRLREFTMKDAYSLDADLAGLERQYRNLYRAYCRIFQRVGLSSVMAVAADAGMLGGRVAHEFMFLTDRGEDTLVLCDRCGYAANRQIARFAKPAPPAEAPRPLEKVATPGAETITALARFLDVPESRTVKVVFFTAVVPEEQAAPKTGELLVLGLVRGDMTLSETKLRRAVGARRLGPAAAAAIRAAGAVPGYASPVGLARGSVLVVVDELVAASPNLVAGANEEGFHLRNVNVGRDFTPDVVTDIAEAAAGSPCPRCGQPLRLAHGVEVGHIFQLGTRYAATLAAEFIDATGQRSPIVMGSYGIGLERVMACIAEAHHDQRGLRWPVTVAPFDVHLVLLPGRGPDAAAAADELYGRLRAAGREVLYDDRDLSAGVKFADADLMGVPLRVTVSERALQRGGVELKGRDSEERSVVPLDSVVAAVQEEMARRRAAAERLLHDVPYPEDVHGP
ncbi:MAG: proline--tRNA ligase [Firmicutes bacterium]|nr:proline--tRNA ligase [Bacillota bacterium]